MKKVKWKFKKGAEPQGKGDFWYDLTMGGYIEPEDMLVDKNQLKLLEDAIAIVESFREAAKEAELFNEF